MAHYAQLGVDNIVTRVWTVNNRDCMTEGGIEKDEIGQAYLREHHGDLTLIKCSYNTVEGKHVKGGTPLRANYPGVGWYYSSKSDIFFEPIPKDMNGQPCLSWKLNNTTGIYEPPVPCPSGALGSYWVWNENQYDGYNNGKGWVSIS